MHIAVDVTKWVSGVLVALQAVIHPSWAWFLNAAFVLFCCDTVTGFWLAVVTKKASSHTLREKTVSKLLQYAVVVCIAAVAHRLTGHHEWMLAAAFGLIAWIEFMSNVENLGLLSTVGGVNMGPFKPFLDRVGRYFDPTGLLPPIDPPGPPKEVR